MTRGPRNLEGTRQTASRQAGSNPWVLLVGAVALLPVWSARAEVPVAPEETGATGFLVAPEEPAAEPEPTAEPAAEEPATEEPRDEPVLPFVPTEPATFPVPYSQRPLNLPRFYARAGGTLRVYHFDDATRALTNQDTSLSLSLGGSFAVTDWLELGVLDERLGMYHPVIGGGVLPQGLLALALTPDREFGDIPVHARVRVVADPDFDVSIDVGVVIPVNGDLALFGATVVRARMSERFAIDSGLEVALRFDADNDPHLDLFLPFSALIQLHPNVFLAARTGVRWVDFDDLAFPLGLELGYTVSSGDSALMDLTLGFGFPALVTPNNADKAQQDVWQVTLAGHAYFSL